MRMNRVAAGAIVAGVAGLSFLMATPSKASTGQCVSISGFVRGPQSASIAGASVVASYQSAYCSGGSTVTDSAGRYTIEVEGTALGAKSYATASAAGFRSQTKVINGGTFAPPLAGVAPSSNDFSLSR
jgi:hypothetical protein